jgi:hypothetical protein
MLASSFFWGAVALFLLSLEPYFMAFFGSTHTIDPGLFYQRLLPFTGWSALVLFQFSLAIVLAFREQFSQEASSQRPLIAWLVLQPGEVLKSGGQTDRWLKRTWQGGRVEIMIWLGMLAVWALAGMTGIGLIPDDRFWNVAGIPILPQQLVLTWLLMLLALDLKSASPTGRLVKLSEKPIYPHVVAVLLWLGAILIWQGTDMKHTYFAPGPYPPNYKRYPFSDARYFDIGGQYALIGKGLNNNETTDRPFLMLYAALLHLIGGQ